MSSLWLQGEGRDSAREEVPPPRVLSCTAQAEWLGMRLCCCAVQPWVSAGSASPPPKPAAPSV